MEEISLKPIGIVHSPYKQKFAIPRQPNLVPAGIGKIELHADFADLNCLRSIAQIFPSSMDLVFLSRYS
ncbi:MAG: hypothetical protein CM1200mP40_05500 [Gammaproteobacteria bacterium]|nr:MAG: hypothetical protein CM1200mP40_05500 [Gammaproteobacteria bacterium]